MAKVAVIMGSDSDMNTMSHVAEILDKFGVNYEMRIFSAHRTPNQLAKYVESLDSTDCEVVIAGAGKAAALPGVCAAYTILPVIGVPMKTSDLGGMDSLLSIVQMPTGVPVATVAIGGAANAALLAVQMIAVHDEVLAREVKRYRCEQAGMCVAKDDKLQKQGPSAFIK